MSTRLPLLDTEVAVLGCEDIIVLKLMAGPVIDWVDATAFLRANRESMDIVRLIRWTAKLDLIGEITEVWHEAFLGEQPPLSN